MGKTSIKFFIQSKVFPFETYVILDRNFLKKNSSKIDFQKGIINFVSDESHLPFAGFVEAETEDDSLFCSVQILISYIS